VHPDSHLRPTLRFAIVAHMTAASTRFRQPGEVPSRGGIPELHAAKGAVTRSFQQRTFRFALALAVFTISWHLIRLNAVNLTLSDFTLFICLIGLAARGRLRRTPLGSATFVWSVGLSLMLGGLFVGTWINGDLYRWVVVAGQYIFAFLLLPMIFMSEERTWIQKAQLYYVCGVALSEALAIGASFVFTAQQTDSVLGIGFLAGNGRVGALAGEANWNGAVIGFAAPMLLNLVNNRMVSLKWAVLLAIPLAWGLLACGSFTGFSATLLALFIYLLVSSPRNLIKFGTPLIAIASLYSVSGLPLPGAFENRVAGAFETGSIDKAGTYSFRATLIAEAWRISGKSLFVGVGVDRYRVVSAYGAPVHHFPLLIFNEGGIVALFGLLILMITLWWLAIRAVRVHRNDGAMAVAVLAVFSIFTFAVPHMYTRLWIGPVMLALAATYGRLPHAQSQRFAFLRKPLPRVPTDSVKGEPEFALAQR
jgi:uncharacterized membrane protein YfbV (UPF0208 family)